MQEISTAGNSSVAGSSDIPGNFTPLAQPQELLESYANGALNDEQLIASLSARCRGYEDATWEALSLLDRYHRRGLLDTGIFLTVKTELNSLVFGRPTFAPNHHDDIRDQHPSNQTKYRDKAAAPSPRQHARRHSSTPRDPESNSSSTTPPDELRPGALLRHRYVLIEPQISTETTVIFKAFDRQRSGLPQSDLYVSVKCLRDELATNIAAQSALKAEFDEVSRLSHPNILRLYDFHTDERHSFIAMEALDGQLLSHVIERFAPLPLHLSHARRIIRDIGLALNHAHQQRIFHPNLNASSVLIRPTGEVRVFGFPALNHPAQIDPTVEHDPFKEDLFAFVGLVYHALSGREPFENMNGKLQRRWQRLDTLPVQSWRAIEQVLSGGETRQWRSTLDWLSAFDGDAKYDAVALADLRPLDQTKNSSRAPGFKIGLAASLAIAAIAAWQWLPLKIEQAQSVSLDASRANTFDSTSEQRTEIETSTTHDPSPSPSPSPAPSLDYSIDSQSPRVDVPSDAPSPMDVTPTVVPAVIRRESTIAPASTQTETNSSSAPAKTGTGHSVFMKPTVSFAESPVVVYQGEPAAMLTLRRTGSTREALLLRWRTVDGSAKSNTAYIPASDSTVAFAAGQRTARIIVPLLDGNQTRFSQWFGVEVLSADGINLGEIPAATVFIAKAEAIANSAP